MPIVIDSNGNIKTTAAPLTSGQIGSGAITGQAGGGYYTIASGTINQFDLASGAIASGNLASGAVNQFTFYDVMLFDSYF